MSIKKGSVTIASSVPTTEWGSIEGTLSDQTDLQNALNSKAPTLSPSFTGIPTAPTASQGTNTNQIASTKFVKTEINEAIQNIDALPDQTGQSGKFLTTNGTDASWGNIPAELPSQTGQAGKVLTTNGTTVSWTEYSPTPDVDGDTIHLNSSDELEVIGTIEKNTGDVKYDWVGTYAEWEAGRNNNTIPDDWVCYITDDFVSSTVTHNIGDIFYSLRTEDMFNGAVACDGSQYDIANYSEGTKSLKSLLDAGKLPYVSIQTFDETVTANGSCRCFGYDGSEATVFKVPKLNDVFIESGIAANNSEFIEAGLPNIISNLTKTTGLGAIIPTSISNVSAAGAFKVSGDITDSKINYSQNSGIGIATLEFDASNSNSIYGNSDTVQPNAVKYKAFIQLANATPESALQTVSTVVNDVNDLKDEIKETLQYKNISNCITEIPQDIKLELNNGTLTLKAGSKVYVPNGFEADGTTQKFDIKIVESDISQTFGSSTGTDLIFLRQNNALAWYSESVSGTTPPSTGALYNTSLNKVQGYNNGSLNSDNNSFPFCLVTLSNGNVTSINQVFNGFGYIGSTVFALPDVKGLIPNGRNEDGSLKSEILTVNSVKTITFYNNFNDGYVLLGEEGLTGGNRSFYYDKDVSSLISQEATYNSSENRIYRYGVSAGAIYDPQSILIATLSISSDKIIKFTPKTTFHALDYNDKPLISSWSMPSEKYIDLTSTSGSTFTAPSNGYVCFKNNNTGTSNVQAYIENTTKNIISTVSSYYNNGGGYVPVSRGDSVIITRSSGVGVVYYRFIYAQGEI